MSTLVAMGPGPRSIRPAAGIAIMMVMVALGPLLIGTAVATTLAHRLVSFGSARARWRLLAAVMTALVAVFALT